MAQRLTRRPARRIAALLLLLLVAAAHLWVTREVARVRAAWGDATQTRPTRLRVAFVRELAPAQPPAAAPAAAPQPKPRRRAKRAPAIVAPAPQPAAETSSAAESIAEPVVEPALAESPAASAEPAASASAPDAAASFEWPPSTRLRYAVSGNYRGEVHGTAQVQWVRADSRYQVHLDVIVGPSFAPLFTRQMSSDGELGAQGLSPRRYDEETKMAFRDPRRVTMFFEPDRIVMANGSERPTVPGVQDTASQFVQLTWMFTLDPALLQSGRTVELPLALPRRVDPWVYDVLGEETLYTPIGALNAVHLKPRREAVPGEILSSELWFAPSLQYLPVRILIHHDAQTYIDLMLAAPPMQAE